jgi:hypothetical protein
MSASSHGALLRRRALCHDCGCQRSSRWVS